jgi:hypothetical protein
VTLGGTLGAGIKFRVDADDTKGITIPTSGNVGIGTTSPTAQSTGATTGILDVSAATGGNLVLHRTGSSDTALFSIIKSSNGTYIDSVGAATAANNAIYFRTNNINADQTSVTTALTIASTGAATFSSPNIADSTADAGNLYVYTTDGPAADKGAKIMMGGIYTGATKYGYASISGRNESGTAGNVSGYMTFATHNNTGGHIERMRINSNGNVGIGSSGNGALLRRLNIVPATDVPQLYLVQSNNNDGGWMLKAAVDGHFRLISYQTTESPKLTVRYDTGNVGIGTDSPDQKLTIEASGGANGLISFKNSSSSTTSFIGVPNANGSVISGSTTADFLFRNETGNMLFQTNGTERMRITSGGNVLIGTTTDAGHKLLVNGTAKFDNPNGIIVASSTQYRQIYFDGFSNLYFWNGSNQSYLSSAGTWVNASDISIKKEITDIKYGLSDLMLLNPRSYKMKTDGLEQIGFIAQEVEKIIPEVVNSDNKGMKGLSYGNIVALLVKAIQEQQQQIQELKNKLS